MRLRFQGVPQCIQALLYTAIRIIQHRSASFNCPSLALYLCCSHPKASRFPNFVTLIRLFCFNTSEAASCWFDLLEAVPSSLEGPSCPPLHRGPYEQLKVLIMSKLFSKPVSIIIVLFLHAEEKRGGLWNSWRGNECK